MIVVVAAAVFVVVFVALAISWVRDTHVDYMSDDWLRRHRDQRDRRGGVD